jgi:SAM-dependent methyltransferase
MTIAVDFDASDSSVQITGELLCEAVDLMPDESVLDVAAGNGKGSLAAARRGAEVSVSDDADALAFPDASFDVVLSTFGAMFAPHQERVASELVRVCRPCGRIGLASWTPDSFVGRMFKVVGRYAPQPPGARSPLEWGTRRRIGELFTRGIACIGVRDRELVFRYRSSRAWLDAFRQFDGPTRAALAVLEPRGRVALEHDLLALADAHNTATTGWRVPSPYLEVVLVRTG